MTFSKSNRTPLVSVATAGMVALAGAMALLSPVPLSAQGVFSAPSVRGLPDFTDLVDLVGPSVVNIRTLERGRQASAGGAEVDPNVEEFFRRFGIPVHLSHGTAGTGNGPCGLPQEMARRTKMTENQRDWPTPATGRG